MAKASRASVPAESAHRSPAGRSVSPPSAPLPAASETPWRIAFALLGVLALLVLWFPVARVPAQYSLNYNEGFNTQMAHMAISGVRLYGTTPQFVYTTYPPVSFYLIGGLGKIAGDINVVGRWIALASFFGVVVLTGMIVYKLTRQLRYAVYAGACFLIWIASYKADRVGMNDPQFLAMLLSAAGLYCYVRDPESEKWLRWSAVLFVVALFTKQSLLALPTAVAVQLFLTNRKRLVTWLIAGAAAGFALLLLTFLVGGLYFLTDLLIPRVHSYDLLMANVAFYLMFFQIPLVVAMVWAMAEPRLRLESLAVWALAAGVAIGFVFCCEGGSDWNHLFDSILALALIAGLLLPAVEKAVQALPWREALLTVLLVVPFFYTSWILLPQRVSDDAAILGAVPQFEKEFAAGADFLRSQPGPALCENLLLCYAAGKPMTYDPFAIDQLVKTGNLPPERLVRLIDAHEYPVIQLDIAAGEPLVPEERQRIPAAFMRELLARYQPVMRTTGFAIFVPKQ
ncbi:MAG TPA: glycosyltransferase family 39 protein [Bryobacteraceae bacterium]|nr:glycosyltransferase family 39 protein [Bryobacteraceae bacterium]